MTLDAIIKRAEAAAVVKSIPLMEPHAGQRRVLAEAARFNVVACGRRWGKTRLGARVAAEAALRGELVGWFAPSYKYLDEAWREILDTLSVVVASSNKTDRVISLTTGGRVDFWTLEDNDAGRGRHYHVVIIDEAAMVRGLRAIWQGPLRPTLSDKVGSAWFLSTPAGPTGFFAEAFRGGQGGGETWAGWKSWQMPTTTNPYIPEGEVEAARLGMIPTLFRQEYLAEFVAPAGAVFDCLDARIETEDTGPTNVVSGAVTIPKDAEIHVGWDFGSANTASVWAVRGAKTGTWYVLGEYHASGDDASKHVERVRSKISKRERSAWGGAASEDAIRDEFNRAGMFVGRPPVGGAGSVEAGINVVYRLLRERRLKIHGASCAGLLEQLTSYSYKLTGDGKLTDLIEGKSDYHLIDALRYLAVSVMDDSRRPITIGRRFAHSQDPGV